MLIQLGAGEHMDSAGNIWNELPKPLNPRPLPIQQTAPSNYQEPYVRGSEHGAVTMNVDMRIAA